LRTDRDKTLLLAVLAVQIHGLTADQVIEHAAAWMVDPAVPLPKRLLEAGLLTKPDVDSLELLVSKIAGSSESLADTILSQAYPPGRIVRPQARPTRPPGAIDGPDLALTKEDTGRYSSISELGRDALGRVLLVNDQFLGRDVALKELIAPDAEASFYGGGDSGDASARLARFVQEARITGQLEHPCIVPVYEQGRREDGTLYYTMKFVRGKTLDAALRDAGTLDRRIAFLPQVLDVCQTLAFAHGRGVIHRDVKPANIMIGDFGETVLMAWGQAKIRGEEDLHDPETTLSMQTLRRPIGRLPVAEVEEPAVTANYMPPEQAEGAVVALDERSDIYAVGALLYELLTGRAPYDDAPPEEVLRLIAAGPPAGVATLEPLAPAELVRICEKAMARDPAARFNSMLDMRNALVAFQTGALVQTYCPEKEARRSLGRVPSVAAIASLVLLLAAMAGIGAYSYIAYSRVLDTELSRRMTIEADRDTVLRARDEAVVSRRAALRQQYLAQIRLAQAHLQEQRLERSNTVLDAVPASERDWVWSYMKSLANPGVMRLEAGPAGLHHAVFAPTGSFIAGLRRNGPPRLWNAVTGDWVRDFEPGSGRYASAAFDPAGTRFAAISAGGPLDVWLTGTGALRTMPYPAAGHALAFAKDGQRVWAGYADGAVIAWDAANGEALQTVQTAGGPVTALALLQEPDLLLITTSGGAVQAWDAARGGMRYGMEAHAAWPLPDGSRFLSSQEAELRLHDAATGQVIQTFPAAGACHGIAFHPDGAQFLVAGPAGVALGRFDQVSPMLQFEGVKPGAYSSAYFLDEGRRVLGCTATSEYTLWDAATRAVAAEFRGDRCESAYTNVSPDGRWLLAPSGPDTAAVFDLRHPCRTETLATLFGADELGGCLHAVDWSAEAGRAALLSDQGVLRVINLNSLDTLTRVEAGMGAPRRVAIAAGGATVLYARDARVLVVGNAESGADLITYSGHEADLCAFGLSPDGLAAVSASRDGSVHAWSTETGILLRALDTAAEVMGLAHGGENIALACVDGSVRIYNAESGVQRLAIDAHETSAVEVAWSPSGDLLASVAAHGEFALWNPLTGEPRGVWRVEPIDPDVEDHRFRVRFSPEGRYLLASAACSPTMVIDTRDGELVMTTDDAQQLAVLDGGATLISFLPSGAIQRRTFGNP